MCLSFGFSATLVFYCVLCSVVPSLHLVGMDLQSVGLHSALTVITVRRMAPLWLTHALVYSIGILRSAFPPELGHCCSTTWLFSIALRDFTCVAG
jgi:hypothetical protein